jgi:SAM-dependent methyltransferase
LQEGLEARDLYRLCGPMRRLTPYFLSWVSLPHWLSPRASRVPRHEAPHYPSGGDSEKARFILRTQFRRLRKALTRTIPLRRKVSDWADYASTLPTYSSDQAIEKRTFVETALAEFRPRSVLDVGCNTGDFSRLAARAGARVIGIDSDETAVGEAWKMARREKLDLLPLVVSLANPTAASGWRNRLYPSFLERASGRFDAVMLLAVLHHLLVKDLVPLEDILDLVCELTRSLAIVEFVDPTDPGFQALARGRKYPQLSRRAFELECEHRFSIIRSHPLQGNHRCLYVLEKKR